jgi:hypothetical protein
MADEASNSAPQPGMVTATLEGLKWAWDNKGWVLGAFGEMKEYFFPKTPNAKRVLIIGPGGVGKTTVGKLIAGHQPAPLELPGQYLESFDPETVSIKDDTRNVGLVIAPGQEHRRDRSWGEIESDIAKGTYHGIILVSAYGYHALGLSYKNHKLYKGDVDEFLSDYLAARREDEKAVLQRLEPFIKSCPDKCWVLSLVTKQDLWFGEQTAVESHYREGVYGKHLIQIQNAKGAQNFRHEFVFASLIVNNFRTTEGENLASTVAGYDLPKQVASARRLVETLAALMQWDKKRA